MHRIGQALHLNDIEHPGAYLCHWNGDLLRVVIDDDGQGIDALPELPCDEAPMLTLLSPDPYVPLSAARMTAANLDLEVQC